MAFSTMEPYEYVRQIDRTGKITESPNHRIQKAASTLLCDTIRRRDFAVPVARQASKALGVCDELNEQSSDVYVNDCEGGYIDEGTGGTLLRDDVDKAFAEEMAWYEKFKAFVEVTDDTCVSLTGRKPLSCRWRDINKRDNERVEVRSRLVAREIKQIGIESSVAETAPSAPVRYVISRAATLSKTGKRLQLMVFDAKRAFLHADALTETYVKPHTSATRNEAGC